MKKLFLYAAVAALAMTAASCQREILIDNGLNDGLVFAASIDGRLDTKTTLNDKKISWELTDSITVNGVVYKATLKSGTTDSYDFIKKNSKDANPTSPYNAFYPTGIQTDTTDSGTLPKTQTYSAGKITNVPMFATSKTTTLSFKTICAVLAIKVDNTYISQIKSIRISSSNKAMSGAFTIGTNSKAVLTAPTDTTQTVTLNCGTTGVTTTSEGTVFYIAIPAQTYQKLKVELSPDGENYYWSMTTKEDKDIVVKENTVYSIDFKASVAEEFSVSSSKKVKFTKGNLYYGMTDSTTDKAYHIEAAQNVTYSTLGQKEYDATHVCHFYWSNTKDWQTSGREPWASSYSYNTQDTDDKFFCGIDNQMTVDGQSYLYALTQTEWDYLFYSRDSAPYLCKYGVSVTTSAGTVDNCLVIAPDGYEPIASAGYWSIAESYDSAAWARAESAGLVCLPAAGDRNSSGLDGAGLSGYYWSATPYELINNCAYRLRITGGYVDLSISDYRNSGYSVRLVSTVSE